MPPVVIAVLGVAGGVTLATWLVKEARRINAILHPHPEPEPQAADLGVGREPSGGRLRPDEAGIYRPE